MSYHTGPAYFDLEWTNEESVVSIRFIRQDGQSVDPDIIHDRFFESAARSGVSPVRANAVWEAAMRGDTRAWDVIEEVCNVEIVDSNAGFGFLE